MSNPVESPTGKKPLSKGMIYFFVVVGLYSLGKLGYGIYQDRIESAKEQAADARDFSQLINEVERNMDVYLQDLNKQLPANVNEGIQLVKVARTDKVVDFTYQVTGKDITNSMFKDAKRTESVFRNKDLPGLSVKVFCTETWTKSLLNLNYQIKAIYRGEGHPEPLEFTVEKADCARFRGLN